MKGRKACFLLLCVGTVWSCHFSSSLFNLGEVNPVIDIHQKHAKDHRIFKEITLKNQMRVLLISDPDLNKSAAAMNVQVGSLSDPTEHPGLAHFLEHMLFLGTKKYPDISEYNRYLDAFQGESNAYTNSESTNYFFEVNHEGFEGAVDRFAQFFVSPMLNPEYVERERNAVDSEHQKNLQDDYWRSQQVLNSMVKKGHPRQKFSTGNNETLAKADRAVLVSFYEKYYSSNRMNLVLMSKQSLDELEVLASNYFNPVKNTQAQPLTFDSQLFDPKDLPRQINIQSIKDIRRLRLTFLTKSRTDYYKSKPDAFICHLIGYEGAGSLLSQLKAEDLATGLSAGMDSTSYAGTFEFEISLTEKGLSHQDRVLDLFFAYVQILKNEGLKRYIYDEQKAILDIDYVYKDPREGMRVASRYAERMQYYKGEEIDKNDLLIQEYSEKDFRLFLDAITPKSMNAMLLSPDVKGEAKERYYQTSYTVQRFSEASIAKLSHPPVSSALHLPKQNPFVPNKLEVLTSATQTNPQKVIDDARGVLWYQLDDRFSLPKAKVQIHLLTKTVNDTAQDKIHSILYVMALGEALNEWKYDINLAGLDYSVSRTDKGILLEYSGYSQHIPDLMASLATKLKDLTIDDTRFETLKTELKRSIQNSRVDNAYLQAFEELRYLLTKQAIHRDDLYDLEHKVDLITPISLADLKCYVGSTLFQKMYFEAIAYGSISKEAAEEGVLATWKTLNPSLLAKEERPKVESIKFGEGKSFARIGHSGSNNNCWASTVQFGGRDLALQAALRVGSAKLRTSYYTELRTKQQLGYIVHSALALEEKSLGMNFLIQSSDYDAFELSKRSQYWLESAQVELAKVTEEELAELKKQVASELREPDKTYSDRHQTLAFEAFVVGASFGYKEQIAKEVEKLSKDQLVSVFKKGFSPQTMASMNIFLLAKGQKPKKLEKVTLLENAKAFKGEATVF